mmetsp:Transcript_28162/g.77750  ORF Transcript_28162/g.77750 Transcript_28162/m.77750 type:complete len:201 (+) Transcript_28162:369-971(+)
MHVALLVREQNDGRICPFLSVMQAHSVRVPNTPIVHSALVVHHLAFPAAIWSCEGGALRSVRGEGLRPRPLEIDRRHQDENGQRVNLLDDAGDEALRFPVAPFVDGLRRCQRPRLRAEEKPHTVEEGGVDVGAGPGTRGAYDADVGVLSRQPHAGRKSLQDGGLRSKSVVAKHTAQFVVRGRILGGPCGDHGHARRDAPR